MAGPPSSDNGASSLHLWWEVDTADQLHEVTAVVEVLTRPQAAQLYFWALQVSFRDGSSDLGAAHLGLQSGAGRPSARSVNWGGYDARGKVLAGSRSGLPSSVDNPNTRDYPWAERRPYRLRIHRAGAGPPAWRGEVVDVWSGTSTVVRDLLLPATALASPGVWSEVFADCDAPPVAVRWTDLRAVTASGEALAVPTVSVTYQSSTDGGCDNTTALLDGSGGVLQVTNTHRTTPPGTRLRLHPAGDPG